jgi:heme-binding NEAT domain protein
MKSAGDEIAKLKAKAPKNLTNVTTDEKVQMYKWRDEYGVMQYSNTPPPQMQDAEQIELNPNHNVIEATRVPEVEVTPTQTSQPEINNPYSVSGMKQAVEDARAVQDILNQRAEEQKRALDNL